MDKMSLCLHAGGWRGYLIVPAMVACLAVAGAFADDVAAPAGQSPVVNLKCRISSDSRHDRRTVWCVELQNSKGELLSQELAFEGDTIDFKDLEPGIHVVCIYGSLGRKSCKSKDLYAPSDRSETTFEMPIDPPTKAVSQADSHTVQVWRLRIPREAQEEMRHSEKAQLEGNKTEAAEHLRRAVEIYPEYVDAWNNLGVSLHRAGDFEQAIRIFRKVTTLDPDFYQGWVNLGASLLSTNSLKAALAANRRAFSLRPDIAIVNSQMALSHYYLHQLDEAKKYFLRVLDLDPAFAILPRIYLAHICLALEQRNEAIHYLREFLNFHPNSPEATRVQKMLRDIEPNPKIAGETASR